MTDGLDRHAREALIAAEMATAPTADATADVALLARVLALPAVWAEPRAGLEDDVVRAVLTATATAPGASVVTPLWPAAARPRRVRPRRLASAAAAAAAVIALAAGMVLTRTVEHPVFRADLTATGVAPGAGAELEMYDTDAGFRITLESHGLRALPRGEYYQAWLQDATGTVVPIGTFSSSDGHVTLWSGVSARHFPIVTITIEPTDKEPAPSGRRVLAGVMHAT
jgi:hypothetical protein